MFTFPFPLSSYLPIFSPVLWLHSPPSLTYSCTLYLHFTGGHPLTFPPSISLTYTLLVILLSSIRSLWLNHCKVCHFTSTIPHFFPSPLWHYKTLIHTFITHSIHSTHTTCTPQITHFHCLHARPLIFIPGPCFACICEGWYYYCISQIPLYLHAHISAIHEMSQRPYHPSSEKLTVF